MVLLCESRQNYLEQRCRRKHMGKKGGGQTLSRKVKIPKKESPEKMCRLCAGGKSQRFQTTEQTLALMPNSDAKSRFMPSLPPLLALARISPANQLKWFPVTTTIVECTGAPCNLRDPSLSSSRRKWQGAPLKNCQIENSLKTATAAPCSVKPSATPTAKNVCGKRSTNTCLKCS